MTVLLGVALVVGWVLLAFETWVIYLLLKQQGRALVAQEEVAQNLAILNGTIAGNLQQAPQAPTTPEGLEVGTPAPDFALPDLEGRQRKLEEFLGEPFLLTFWSTSCGFCEQMAPELGKLPAGAPRVLLISRGEATEHRALAKEHGWDVDIVLEEGWDVSTAYRSGGTPTGYLIDADGKIASGLTIGSQGLLALAHAYAESRGPNGSGSSNGDAADLAETLRAKTEEVNERARAAGLAVRDLSESRVGRDGLTAGTRAPEFTLPDLEEKEHSLADFKGGRTLLVFSDVECAPCDALMPELAKIHRERGVDVVMISRGDPDANRRKAKEYGLEFPVLLQRSWELSKKYELFGTPVGYLIDENGVIEQDAAVGAPEILRLVPRLQKKKRRRARARR